LDPERFFDYDAFLAEEQEYGAIAVAAQALLDGAELDTSARTLLAEQLEGVDLGDAASRKQAVEKLLDRHGTGRVLFRNSRANIQGFPERHLNVYPMALPDQYKTAIKVMGMMGGNGGDLQVRALRYIYPEKIFQQFEGDSTTWTQFDPRIDWLLELLLSARQQKVLVICSEAATAIALEEAVRTREGIRAAVFHEGMSLIERDKSAAY
ncbi:RNA polymerase-binding ATPase, partial [Aeromonas salmonicida]